MGGRILDVGWKRPESGIRGVNGAAQKRRKCRNRRILEWCFGAIPGRLMAAGAGLGDIGGMDTSGMDGLGASLMAMQQGKLQFEVGVKLAAKAMEVERGEGDAMVGLVSAAAKVMEAGQKGVEKGIEGMPGLLDVYA